MGYYSRQKPEVSLMKVSDQKSNRQQQYEFLLLVLKLINHSVMPACRNSSRAAWICLCFNFRSRIIIFKVATNVQNIFNQRSPPYLVDLVTFSVSGPSVVKYGQQQSIAMSVNACMFVCLSVHTHIRRCLSNKNSVQSTRISVCE